MTNAEKAIELIINFFDSEKIYEPISVIRKKVYKWEAKFNEIDFVSLAAIAISDPNETTITNLEIREIRNFYFPSKNLIERNLY